MEVLKTHSPAMIACAPKAVPRNTLPSSRARTAGLDKDIIRHEKESSPAFQGETCRAAQITGISAQTSVWLMRYLDTAGGARSKRMRSGAWSGLGRKFVIP